MRVSIFCALRVAASFAEFFVRSRIVVEGGCGYRDQHSGARAIVLLLSIAWRDLAFNLLSDQKPKDPAITLGLNSQFG
jgi:hypothetical protein